MVTDSEVSQAIKNIHDFCDYRSDKFVRPCDDCYLQWWCRDCRKLTPDSWPERYWKKATANE